IYSVILRPLPYANAERIVRLNQSNGQSSMCCLPFGNYDRWRQASKGMFEALGGIWFTGATLTGRGDPVSLTGFQASAEYWKAMYIPPAAGRYFTEAEDREGAQKVVVISDGLWQNRFADEAKIVGQNITLNANAYLV